MISLLLLILLFNPFRELESENAGLREQIKRKCQQELALRRALDMQMFINELRKAQDE